MCVRIRRLSTVALLLLALVPVPAFGARLKPCVSAEEARNQLNKDVCITAHIYDVVQLADGTRFLDVCTPQTPDDKCQFTIISLWEDREEVGELKQYRDMDVELRGIIQPMRGRAGMVLSHARQFNGGPPKFRPNARLARGFGGDESKPPVRDPNLGSQGGRRAFMNTRDREPTASR